MAFRFITRRLSLAPRTVRTLNHATLAAPFRPPFRPGAAARNLLRKEVVLPLPVALGGLYACNYLLQEHLGSGTDVFHGTFVTDKSPDDIAEFYQAEDLLKIIAGHPFFFNLFMDKVVVGEPPKDESEALLSLDESKMIVRDFGMEVAFEIIEEGEEVEGETKRTSFVRHERFKDYVPFLSDRGVKILLWDQTWTYGFRVLDDGSTEVYHHCNEFYGPWPVRLVVSAHQRYVLWACRTLINSRAFGNEDEAWMDKKEEMLECILKYTVLHPFE